MFKIYKQTLNFGTTSQPQQIEYKLDEMDRNSTSKILTIPAMIAGAVVGAVVFSMLFALLLIPLGMVGFKAWRLIRAGQKQTARQTDDKSITAEYSVINDKRQE